MNDDFLSGGTGDNDPLLGHDGSDVLNGGSGNNDYCDSGPPPGDDSDTLDCEAGPG
jgi:Ca2+-binding RTX toxin-like protein